MAWSASVTVLATSNIGDTLKPEVHLYELGSNKDYWTGTGQTANNVPPGYYQVKVSMPGYRHFEKTLDVIDEHTDVRVILTPSEHDVGEVELRGRVQNVKFEQRLWVLLSPLAGNPDDATESLVGKDGSFRVATTHSGPYLLALVRGEGEVLNCQRVYMRPQNAEITIDARTESR